MVPRGSTGLIGGPSFTLEYIETIFLNVFFQKLFVQKAVTPVEASSGSAGESVGHDG